MQYLSDYRIDKIQHFGIRILICFIVLLIYFSIWRPARIAITAEGVYPQLKALQKEGRVQMEWKNQAILTHYQYQNISKRLQYRPGFGFFFLVTLIALIFVTQKPRYFFLLIILQFATSLLAYYGLLIGITGDSIGFVITDIMNAYLAPALSLAIIPLAVREKHSLEID